MQHHRTIVVADHHKSVFVCQVLDRETGEARRLTLSSRRLELEPFLKELAGPVLVFVEACRSWEWVSDMCEDLGVDLKLINPSEMPEIARSKSKTDHKDVDAMVQRLLVTGELPESYRANRPQRELRGLTRRLSVLRKERRKLVHRIHAENDSHGMPAKKESFCKKPWREEMQAALSEDAWMVLESLLEQIDFVFKSMARLEKRIQQLMRDRADYKKLHVVPGIGPITGATILAESPGIERFASSRQYAAFTGLVPRVRSSAGKAKMGHITRCGPPDLRWALGMSTMVSLRCKVSTPHSRMFRRKRKKGKAGKEALCAAAHKLARIVHLLLTTDQTFNPTPGAKVA